MEITVKQKKILELVEKKRTKNEQRELIKLLKEEETKGKKNEKKAWAVWGGEGDTGRMRYQEGINERKMRRYEWYEASNLSN